MVFSLTKRKSSKRPHNIAFRKRDCKAKRFIACRSRIPRGPVGVGPNPPRRWGEDANPVLCQNLPKIHEMEDILGGGRERDLIFVHVELVWCIIIEDRRRTINFTNTRKRIERKNNSKLFFFI